MSVIVIETLTDSNDCEQCGGGYEQGGRVIIDGEVIFEHIPYASCYDNVYIQEEDLLKKALEYLGHTVEVK